MKDIELGWLAGLLEGEGYFAFTTQRRLIITMDSTDMDVAARVAQLFNVTIQGPYSYSQEKNKPVYRAQCSGDKAAKVMRSVLPYMCERRTARIIDALDKWEKRKIK
jgi:hypothetical protein